MKPPFRENGLCYGFGPDGKRVCTGAQMGRCDVLPDDRTQSVKLHLRRVPFVDYCYDQGGAYWGGPANLWCAWGDGVVIYVRDPDWDREAVKAEIREVLPNARFYR